MTNLDSILKSTDITLLTKVHIDKTMVFPQPSMDVRVDNKESLAPKNWCFQTVVLEMTLESPLDCKEIKPINPKTNQLSIFTGWTYDKVPILWPPDAKSQLIGKDPDVGKDLGQQEKEATEDEMVEWHH